MAQKLVYVELKSGYEHNGPAWIGHGVYNRTGNTLYFNGLILHKANLVSGNFYDIETNNEYWVSGVKKDGTDRHQNGNGKIHIDADAVAEYLTLRNLEELPLKQYITTTLIKEPAKKRHTEMMNSKL